MEAIMSNHYVTGCQREQNNKVLKWYVTILPFSLSCNITNMTFTHPLPGSTLKHGMKYVNFCIFDCIYNLAKHQVVWEKMTPLISY